jgi:hypothetical protein
MNQPSPTHHLGMIGQLLVQTRLLQFGVEAAPPLTDSGNDLIAIRFPSIHTIQVKTRRKQSLNLGKIPKRFSILALVHIAEGEERHTIDLERSSVYLLPANVADDRSFNRETLKHYVLSEAAVNDFFEPSESQRFWDAEAGED